MFHRMPAIRTQAWIDHAGISTLEPLDVENIQVTRNSVDINNITMQFISTYLNFVNAKLFITIGSHSATGIWDNSID